MTEEQHKAIISASDYFILAAKKVLTVEGRLHAETLIGSVARMAGSLMYRSFGFDKDITPGTTVLSDKANVFGPQLMNVMLSTLQQIGVNLGEENLDREYASAKFSQLTFKESHDRLAPFFLAYCKIASLKFQDGAMAAAIATGILVHECMQVLSAEKGGAIAIYGFVEGTKTVPFPIGSAEAASTSS